MLDRRRARSRLAVAAAVVVLSACAVFRPDRPLRVLTGFVSHTLCANTFVSGLDPDQVYAEAVKPLPGVWLFDWALRYHVDRARREVNSTWAGAFASRAIHREGVGCLVVLGDPPLVTVSPSADVDVSKEPAPPLAVPSPVAPADEALTAALDRAFAEPEPSPTRRTKAVVVVRDGRVVAERYAPGYGVDTPLLGYSMAKSVVNALVGILVRQGRLSVDQPAPVPAWRDADDPRRAITVDHLLRMTSGLALAETHSGFDPLSQMLYVERDMAGYAERARLEAPPGTRFQYTGGNTLILSRIVRDAVGGRAEDVLRFARRELFDPLGMRGVTLELDATGTPVGSTYALAPARDWARFGLLYLNDGMSDGRRILPEGWVAYSSSRTLSTNYAAGFWLAPDRAWPRDVYLAAGMLGQNVVVVPSERLVIVRFGITDGAGRDRTGVERLLADVIRTASSTTATR
jgi:CubicO group peptidase (beta-lactamase class C family)